MIQPGLAAPDFCLPASRGNEICLKDLAGKWAVVFFYSKDGTSG
jgi:peroxiredoxin Q/BCP